MSKRFLDEDALNYNPRKPGADRHVSKHQQRNKGLEVVFDPKGHKEYLNGFRKRKQARRKEAVSQLQKLQRQQMLEERAERRQAFKDQLGLPDLPAGEAAGDRDPESDDDVQVFRTGGLTSTVTVAAIATHSDSEAGSEDDQGRARPAPRQHHPPPQQQQRPQEESQYSKGPTKLSKTSLRVLARTKLKIEGKKSGGKAKGQPPGAGPPGRGAKREQGAQKRGKGKGRR